MRQGQQNRRGRGRNRNGGGGGGGKSHHNPLTRSFESNGPDVKIRGTPSHIAEKYMSLARDAQSSGDPVLAENYLQHAEHYNRIIMAFREQTMQQSGETMNGNTGRHGQGGEGEEFGDDEGDDVESFQQPMRGSEPQPRHQQHNRYDDRDRDRDRQPRYNDDRQHRSHNDQGRRERYQDHRPAYNGERNSERNGERSYNGDRQHAQPQQMQPPPAPPMEQPVVEPAPQPRAEAPAAAAPAPAPRRRERFAASNHEQPEFLRRPVRRPRREAAATSEAAEPNGAAPSDTDSD